MIPVPRLPGYDRWGKSIPELLNLQRPLWIHGETGCGVSTFGTWVAERRGTLFLDDAELLDAAPLGAWLQDHPSGVIGSHRTPEETSSVVASHCVVMRLSSLEEDPESMQSCLEALAAEEDLEGPFPSQLVVLPCPGNLRGLRNRLIRWKLLGQLPEDVTVSTGAVLPLEAEDLATNLHVLERLLLHRALRRSYGNRVEAAMRLGVSRRQLYLLIERHGDPVRGEAPTSEGPKRLEKQRSRQNSSKGREHR